jgi:predicted O-linked N-acetylglucosamine transferase (SPINDLY family)
MSDIEKIIELGLALQRDGKLFEAERTYYKVLEIEPKQADAIHLLGMVAFQNQDYEKAIELINEAILLNPKTADYHNNISVVYLSLKQIILSKSHVKIALQLNPKMIQAHYNLGNLLFSQGDIKQSLIAFKRSLELDKNNQNIWANYLFTYNFSKETDHADVFNINRKWGKNLEKKIKTKQKFCNHKTINRRLKIAYFLPELDKHVTFRYLAPVLNLHNKVKFELAGYGNRTDNEPPELDITNKFNFWTDISGFDAAKIAETMRNDQIDILLHPCTYKSRYRILLAHRAAPIQIACINLVSTTGLMATDYLITDEFVTPINLDEKFYTEKLIRLSSFNTYNEFIGLNDTGPLPALENQFITFGSCNNIAKINSDVVHIWAKILRKVKNSKLLLKHRALDISDQRNNIASAFAKVGISDDRLIFRGFTSNREEYLNVYNEIDIALDPFPFGGGTVSYEALWMGVPVLTITGSRIMERLSGSLMHRLGLKDWILKSKHQYVETAEFMAKDIVSLSNLRQNLRMKAQDTIFNAKKYTLELENALEKVWGDYIV